MLAQQISLALSIYYLPLPLEPSPFPRPPPPCLSCLVSFACAICIVNVAAATTSNNTTMILKLQDMILFLYNMRSARDIYDLNTD